MSYPNLKQSVWLLALLLLIALGLLVLLAIPGTLLDYDLTSNSYVQTLTILVSFVLVIAYARRRIDRSWSEILLFKTVPWKLYPSLAVSTVGLSITISILERGVQYLIPMPEWVLEIFRDLVWKETPFAFAFYNLAIQPPLIEEVLFRGVILIGLLANQRRSLAVFWSALLFALFHLNPWQFPAAFVLGFVFAFWVIQTGSLLPAIAGHAINNFLALTVARYEIFGPMDDFNNLVSLPWWLDVCGIVLVASGLWWFNQIAKREGAPLEFPADPAPVEAAADGEPV
ncbi:MAG: type II CAAX endopeptidase family protein [Gemmatimonadota bacterium]|nr:type II CAAX endopeptidase family protein [Gemmatimonadota bacterium]